MPYFYPFHLLTPRLWTVHKCNGMLELRSGTMCALLEVGLGILRAKTRLESGLMNGLKLEPCMGCVTIGILFPYLILFPSFRKKG